MRAHALLPPILGVIVAGILITGIVVWWRQQSAPLLRPDIDRPAVKATVLPAPRPDGEAQPLSSSPAAPSVPAAKPEDTRTATAPTSGLERFADKRASVEQRLAEVARGNVVVRNPETQALLVRVLRDREEHPSIRNEAANLLTGATSEMLAEQLTRVLADATDTERFRSYAVQHLTNIGTTAAFMENPALAARCRNAIASVRRDPQREVQREAWLALCQVNDPEALADIAAVLADPASNRCDVAIRVVEVRNDRTHAPALRTLAVAGDATVRVLALRLLGLWQDVEAARLATAALSDESPVIRAAAKDALTAMGVLPSVSQAQAEPAVIVPPTATATPSEQQPEQAP